MLRYFLLLLIIVFAFVAAQDLSYDLKLTITADKSVYIEGESVWIKVEVTNLSAEKREVFDLTDDGILAGKFLSFSLKNSLGETIPYGTEGSDSWPKISLGPGESLYNYFDLPDYYGSPITDPYLGRRYLPEDIYQCTATFRLNIRAAAIQSNTLMFTVRKAAGTDLTVYQNFINAYKTWLLDYEDEQAISLFQDMINRYPQSVFTPLASYYINKIMRISDQISGDALTASIDFIGNHPETPYAYKVVKALLLDAYQNSQLDRAVAKINIVLPKMEPYFPGITGAITARLAHYQSDLKR